MTDHPDLRDLLPDDVGPDELARLARVHELLVSAGAPAELPPHLESAPRTGQADGGATVLALGRSRWHWRTVAIAAAAAAAVLFGVGFFSGWAAKESGFKAAFGPVPMRGAGGTSNAIAEIWVAPADKALNWTSKMNVRGLPELGQDSYYALYLTDAKTGRKILVCTAFAVHAGVTTVTFNFPGKAKGRGWLIVSETPGPNGTEIAKPVLWTAAEHSSGTA